MLRFGSALLALALVVAASPGAPAAAATLDAAEADVVLAATPIDLTRVLATNKPITRVRYELAQVTGRPLAELIAPIVERVRGALVASDG